jgi:O-antigen ligase
VVGHSGCRPRRRIALCLFVAFRWRAIDRRSALTVALLTGLGCVAAKALQFHDPIFQMVDAADQQGADAFTAGRLTLWLATIDAWRESPWIGHGTGSLFWTVFVGWRHTQPHNAVLQFLFSWGVIGALPACWLLLRAVLAAVRSAVREPAVWPVLTLAFSLMGMSMVDGALSYPRFVSMIAVGLALAFAAGMNRNPETG